MGNTRGKEREAYHVRENCTGQDVEAGVYIVLTGNSEDSLLVIAGCLLSTEIMFM